jgi:DNA-binding MarR family transcriptional regulator
VVTTLIPRARASRQKNKSVENAIYAYIQAIRALGRTQIVTTEIADALSLPTVSVNRAISSLNKKGVKVLNG